METGINYFLIGLGIREDATDEPAAPLGAGIPEGNLAIPVTGRLGAVLTLAEPPIFGCTVFKGPLLVGFTDL